MQEHPVPQNVTGYEFHLIGQMTLKQFVEVATGVVAAVLVYWTNLPLVFKYPLMAFVGLLGVALAFIPLEGRPLDRWFFAFIKSVYQPTMFFWKKTDTTPPVFTYAPPKNMDTTPQVDYTPIRQSRLQEYVHTVKTEPVQKDAEALAADEILKLFTQTSSEPISSAKKEVGAGRITEMNIAPITQAAVTDPQPPKESILPTPTGTIKDEPGVTGMDKNGVTPDLIAQTQKAPATLVQGSLNSVTSPRNSPSSDQVKPVQALQGFPFPNKPTSQNMLAGMVVTNENKIVENAIITITRQTDNTPVRAIKTNTLGQFSVVTPLEKGTYTILTEKDGLRFDKYSLVLNNQVIEPILIQSQP